MRVCSFLTNEPAGLDSQYHGTIFQHSPIRLGRHSCNSIVGPVLEELLFRGAITKALLQQYNPTKAILISALLFGVFHINPAQILPAFLIGILLAWTYYKTVVVIPCIFMHILNNSLSVYLSIKYPEAENMDDLISGTPYLIILIGAIVILAGVIPYMQRMTSNK